MNTVYLYVARKRWTNRIKALALGPSHLPIVCPAWPLPKLGSISLPRAKGFRGDQDSHLEAL